MGPPKVELSSGERLPITSKKAIALLATLATADRFERSRVWLQHVFWGSRAQKQAQSSLRRELSNLRKILAQHDIDLIRTDQRLVSLNRESFQTDLNGSNPFHGCEFCEGIDLAGEEGFEDWLREMRSRYAPGDFESDARSLSPASVPRSGVSELRAQIAVAITGFPKEHPDAEIMARRVGASLSGGLAKLRWLPVVDAGQTSSSILHNLTSKEVSDTLGVRYVARSQILEMGPNLTVNFALLEMPGRIIRWTDTRQLPADPQDERFKAEIARAINCLGASFDTCEQRNFPASDEIDIDDLVARNWRVRFYIDQFTKDAFEKAEKLIIAGLDRYPENSEFLMLRANLALWQHWIKRADTSTTMNLAPLIRAAMRADPGDARGPLFSGILDTWHRRFPSALRHLRQACELDPSMAPAFAHLGAAHALSGDPQSAIEPLRHSLFLSPLEAKNFFPLGSLATAYWMLDRYEEALDQAQALQLTHPGYVLAHALETACLAAMDRPREAAEARARMLDEKPYLYRQMLDWMPFEDPAWNEKLRRGIEFDKPVAAVLHLAGGR
ncbi:hypothetical protein [Qipengyuania sp. JC766]|uniref:hypothetical protein n=1 Tax=Qipengyuania sp. JC766 TaxID=3232139 RepID=UPI0034598DED